MTPLRTAFLMLIIMSMLAGCVPSGDEVSIRFSGSVNVTDAGFAMEGYIVAQGGIPDRNQYRGIAINTFTKEKKLIDSYPLGTLPANQGELDVSISNSEIPHYVTIESPDFWKEDMSVTYYYLDEEEENYYPETVYEENELPVRND